MSKGEHLEDDDSDDESVDREERRRSGNADWRMSWEAFGIIARAFPRKFFRSALDRIESSQYPFSFSVALHDFLCIVCRFADTQLCIGKVRF